MDSGRSPLGDGVPGGAGHDLGWVNLVVTPTVGAVGFAVGAVIAGVAVYLDARSRGRDQAVAALLGFTIAGLFLAGSVPSLVALVVTNQSSAPGFPTAVRIVPGVVAVLIYLVFR